MKNQLELVTTVVEKSGLEMEVYVDRKEGRVYLRNEKGIYNFTSVDVYGGVMKHDELPANVSIVDS